MLLGPSLYNQLPRVTASSYSAGAFPLFTCLDTAKTEVSPESAQAGSDLTHTAVFQRPLSLVNGITIETAL